MAPLGMETLPPPCKAAIATGYPGATCRGRTAQPTLKATESAALSADSLELSGSFLPEPMIPGTGCQDLETTSRYLGWRPRPGLLPAVALGPVGLADSPPGPRSP